MIPNINMQCNSVTQTIDNVLLYQSISLTALHVLYTDAPPPHTVIASPLSEPGKIRVSWTPPTPPIGSTIREL